MVACPGGDAGTRNIVSGHAQANNLFLNMEHSSHKNHVVDVTTTGTDVVHHEERLLGRR